MMHNTLIFICNSAQEAQHAAIRVDELPEISRFFIFLGNNPQPQSLTWMLPSDNYITLPKFNTHTKSEDIIVRAGLVYSGGWNTLFCRASNAPATANILAVKNGLNNDGVVVRPGVWGITREHFVLFGIPERDNPQSWSDLSNLDWQSDISNAMQGLAASDDAVISALKEVTPSSHAIEIWGQHNDYNVIAWAFAHKFTSQCAERYTDQKHPVMIILVDRPPNEKLQSAQTVIPPYGAILVISYREREHEFDLINPPYRSFQTKSGLYIDAYRNRSNV